MLNIQRVVTGPLATNCYIVSYLDKTIVIDPAPNSSIRIIYLLDRNIITRVDYIIVTHGHFDHISDAQTLKEVTNAQILMHKYDVPLLDRSYSKARSYGIIMQYPEVDEFVENDHVVRLNDLEIHLIWSPGHTKGSITIYIPRYSIIFSGDTLLMQGVYIDPYNGSYQDYVDTLDKLESLLFSKRRTAIQVLPGHGSHFYLTEEVIQYLKQVLNEYRILFDNSFRN